MLIPEYKKEIKKNGGKNMQKRFVPDEGGVFPEWEEV